MEKYLGLPPDGSAHGPAIDNLIGVVHWLMFALFIGWGIYFVLTLVRFRSGRQRSANYHGVRNHASTYIEVAVIVIEAVLLVAFSIPIWAERVDAFPSEKESTVVRIVAEQFAWNVHYPGPDGVFGKTALTLVGTDNPLGLDRTDPAAMDDITTINQLNVPTGKPVIIHLTSKDVIHSLNLPPYRVKQDAIPGLSIPVWFEPTRTSAEIRAEMASTFQVGTAISTTTTLRIPAAEEIPAGERPGWLLIADVAAADGSALLSAGDELNADNAAVLAAAGITSVRARPAAKLDRYLPTADVTGPDGGVVAPAHTALSEDVVTALINAGIAEVTARRASLVDPWVLNETLTGADGAAIASPGDFLSEEIVTRAAAAGRTSIAVAPASPTEIACAQLCGLGHYRMRGYMEVQTPDDFRRWLDEQEASVREQFGTAAESGDGGASGDAASDSTAGGSGSGEAETR